MEAYWFTIRNKQDQITAMILVEVGDLLIAADAKTVSKSTARLILSG